MPTPPKQCAHTMNTVRLCFTVTVAFLVVTSDWSATDAEVCCNSSSVASSTGVASCQNKNRTFHMIETINGNCDGNQTAVQVWKCCPPGQQYDPEVRFCGLTGMDRDEHRWRMMQRLWNGLRAVSDAVMVGYDYEQPKCDDKQVLVDVPAVEVRRLMKVDPSAVELPPGYCIDLTPSDEMVARTCRQRDQYCGRGNYTCVNKCCNHDQMYVNEDDGWKCKQSEKPFTMSTYKTDADGRLVGQSNSTVLPYNVELRCFPKQMLKDGFMLTMNGSLYLTGNGKLVPDFRYCVDYYADAGAQVAAVLQAFVCDENSHDSWVYIFIRASDVASAVCLTLTLFVYNTLPSLQNSRNYYVKFYMACELVSSCMYASQWFTEYIKGHNCVLYGYFTLFAVLTSICWLNVICFDIYWMLRYNISINRNTSISVRTIMYHIYCWGLSSICVFTGYLFQHSQNEMLIYLAPDIGHPVCWFNDKTRYGILIFYLIPSTVMVTTNLTMFFLTALYFLRIKSEINGFKGTHSKPESCLVYKEKFVMSIKLFLIMGISYFPWILCSLFKFEEGIIWDFSDAMTSLQGVSVFIIFVAKRKVILDLRNKFKGSMDQSESTQINTVTVSS
ncbi:G-protein coupled receptor Mth2 [Acyrthosiphon pisum]|uniref:G-protein coupled receptors family 2 profile 2 domain-containing protein n=1 Tax=Acyrthosiphon pisum TaxID=7029 RepID=A0A8R2A9S0_ACYPI|nr:G-protein coupled receptor Mth2 [Acyrthosiphon pisum]|eukprot:XP_003242502.2 PREDICTED: G-protein coupled receptor Mth2 [Acyrthosiphon pisum]